MPQNGKIENLLIPTLWMAIGFVSWYISIYLFSYVLSPILIDAVRKTNAIAQSALIKNSVNLLFTKAPDFMLCFLFAIALSYFTQYTKLRLSLFIFGMVAISLYMRVEGLMAYMGAYSELPSWVITYEIEGFVALLVMIPLISIAGCRLGNHVKMRKTAA